MLLVFIIKIDLRELEVEKENNFILLFLII